MTIEIGFIIVVSLLLIYYRYLNHKKKERYQQRVKKVIINGEEYYKQDASIEDEEKKDMDIPLLLSVEQMEEAADGGTQVTSPSQKDFLQMLDNSVQPTTNDESNDSGEKKIDMRYVVVLYLQCQDGLVYTGSQLFKWFYLNHLRFGARDIFHYHPDEPDEHESAWFQIANGLHPGTFDYDNPEQFTTPILCFILQLKKNQNNLQFFEKMLTTAINLQKDLKGQLLDSEYSHLSSQLIEHYRQLINEFDRQAILKKDE